MSDNGTGASTVYNGSGVTGTLVVTLPSGPTAAPTGIVYYGGTNFVVTSGPDSGPAQFLFAGEHGQVFAWSPAVPPPAPSTIGHLVIESSTTGAVYKGIAVSSTAAGDRLYLTDFRNRRIDAGGLTR